MTPRARRQGRGEPTVTHAPASEVGTDAEASLGAPRPETTWVQPIPDQLVTPSDGDPAEVAISRESIRLAFIRLRVLELIPNEKVV